MFDVIVAALGVALLGWAALGFWRGLSLAPHHYLGGGLPWCSPASFNPWDLIRHGRMYRAHIAESYDADGERVIKKAA
jgi:hypothetical protein